MNEKIEKIRKNIQLFCAKSKDDIEAFRIKYLGKKGCVTKLFEEFKNLSSEEKIKFGVVLNQIKNEVKNTIKKFSKTENQILSEDITKPGLPYLIGSRHPISLVKNLILKIFNRIGFIRVDEREIEDDWHNFSALNLPIDHPARKMQDTFFIQKNPDILLRTHTSSVQIRYMENNSPPIRILSTGKVYRNEVISARSHCMFHQIEGLYIDKNVSFADLKKIINYFSSSLFRKSRIRLRPSYFPFTAPSAEVDVYWGLKNEVDSRITRGTGWLEVMGCGMVYPKVLKNVNIDPETFSGFAFGIGIERIALLIYKIEDIRMYFNNDLRFLKQFKL